MRHRVTVRKLGRTASHRRATLAALSTSLIEHKRIRTTVAKAKATQRTIEPIITRAKLAHKKEAGSETKDVHARRQVAKLIKNPAIVRELFDEIAPKVAERNGGYTRVVKLGQRDGDGAHLAIIELVDYNEATTKKSKAKKKATKAAAVAAAAKKEEQAKKAEEAETAQETEKEEEAPATEEKPAAKSASPAKKKTKSKKKPDDASDDVKDEAKEDKGEQEK
jgi:large subunit ribosomal protein L17